MFGLGEIAISQVVSPHPLGDVEAVVGGITQSLKAVPARRTDARLRIGENTGLSPFGKDLPSVLADPRNVNSDGDVLVIATGAQIDQTLFHLLERPDVQNGFGFTGESCIATVEYDGKAVSNGQFAYLSELN